MNRPAPRPRHQAGLSLLELLIAVTLGLLLLGGLLTVYSASSLSYRVAENTNRMQEGARHAFSIIGSQVRSAGYLGCFSGPTGPTNLAVPNIPFTPQTYLVGHENVGVGNHVGTLAGNAAVDGTYPYVAGNHGAGNSGSDALSVRRASTNSIALNGNVANTRQPPIPIRANTLGLSNNDYVLVGDCDGVDMICAIANTFSVALAASATQGCTGNTASPLVLSRAYLAVTMPQVRAFEEATLHIRLNPANQPALYWRSRVGGAPQTEELVEGVQDMQLCFGEDTDTPPDRTINVYRPANAVANWANVVSVRVTLLMRSVEDGIATAPQAYGIDRNCDDVIDAGETFTPTDRRVRRAFTNTFSVRNRLP